MNQKVQTGSETSRMQTSEVSWFSMETKVLSTNQITLIKTVNKTNYT